MTTMAPPPVTIAEDVQGGLTIELRGDDLPYGRMRELAAFESGGEVKIADQGIYMPGNTRPVLQVMQITERPMVLKGAFRDHMFGVVGHARTMRSRLQQLRSRANPLRITWESEERYGLLIDAKFGEENVNNITYELTFFIAVPPDVAKSPEQIDISARSTSPDDLAVQMRAQARAQRAAQLALAITATVQAALTNAWNGLSGALDNVALYTAKFASATLSTPQHALAAQRQVAASCRAAQNNVATLKDVLDSARADTTMVVNNSVTQVQWWQSLYSTETLLDQILDNLRKIRAQTLAQVRQSTRLYRVQPSDTLESIALQQLGSRSRALDLGIRQDDLVVGKFIRIPEAA